VAETKKIEKFKVKSRRYFLRTDIENVISGKPDSKINEK
jgi:hypothetical protein